MTSGAAIGEKLRLVGYTAVHDIILLVCLLVAGVAFGGLLAVGFYVRRGEARPDAGGVRSVAMFRGGRALEGEVEAAEDVGPGEGALRAIVARLEASGVTTTSFGDDEQSWGVHVERAGHAAYLLLAMRDDDEWLLWVLDPSSGGAGPRELLPIIDAALREIHELDEITWKRREDVDGSGSARPIG